MMIELHHPNHGVKHALSEAEAAADEKNGWTRIGVIHQMAPAVVTTAEAQMSSAEITEAVDAMTHEEMVAAYRAKFGRKPHGKMSDQSLAAALK